MIWLYVVRSTADFLFDTKQKKTWTKMQNKKYNTMIHISKKKKIFFLPQTSTNLAHTRIFAGWSIIESKAKYKAQKKKTITTTAKKNIWEWSGSWTGIRYGFLYSQYIILQNGWRRYGMYSMICIGWILQNWGGDGCCVYIQIL